jgi:hypothetical protein
MDIFRQLGSFQWRSIEVPCESFDMDLTQDHAEHKWPDQDGAHIEATGLNPRVFTAKALFLNGIKPGPAESQWSTTGPYLYPDQYRKFVSACADRSTGVLQHPEFGLINAKCRSLKTHWSANKRDGVLCDVLWVESATNTISRLSEPSPIQNAQTAALNLDTELAAMPADMQGIVASSLPPNNPALPSLQPPAKNLFTSVTGTFASLTGFLAGTIDMTTLYQKSLIGKIDNLRFQVDQLNAAIDRAKDVRTSRVKQACERFRDATLRLKNQFTNTKDQPKVFIVPKGMTLSQISAITQCRIEILQSMNAQVLSGLKNVIVPAGTSIRYVNNA